MRYFLLVDEDLNILGGEGLSYGIPAPRQDGIWVESEGLKGYEIIIGEDGNLISREKEKTNQEKVKIKKTLMQNQVKMNRDEVETKTCPTPFGVFDTNIDSQRKINGACTAAMALGTSYSVNWRLSNNSFITLNNEDMITVGLLVAAHVDACQQRKNALDSLIDAATTLEDLEAIDVNIGWPPNN